MCPNLQAQLFAHFNVRVADGTGWVRAHQYKKQYLASQHKEDKDILARVQQWAIIMIKGLEHLSYKERLKELGLFSIETKRLKRDIINVYKNLWGDSKKSRDRLFSVISSERTRCSGHKLKHRKSLLNMTKN
ncbi:hypothetical protein QYF61_005319 [Mycteria americana]|uniref:Uncharacterized protein n=1 Tax=Mycteria americana TaxID=33587 RepID=A0AAN7MUC0_MYCAM|nr:hypothetical protein QYF61_005319 [Mycteria americana]